MATPLFFISFAGILCFSMVIAQEIGRRIGVNRLTHDPENGMKGTGVIEGGLFAVWGLLLAFTFSGGASRFDMRRSLVGQEANAIGTAYLRLDLLPQKNIAPMKDLFRRYVDLRIETYRKASDEGAWKEPYAKSMELQKEIWNQTHQATGQPNALPVLMLLLPALNAMFDITTTRMIATQIHPPMVIYWLLFLVSCCCALFIGFGQAVAKRRSWLHIVGFVLVNTLIIYVILDMEFPRRGLIRVDAIDNVLIELRQTLKK